MCRQLHPCHDADPAGADPHLVSIDIPDRFDRLVLFERRPDIAVGQQAHNHLKINGPALLEHLDPISGEMSDHWRNHSQLDFLFLD